MTALNTCIPEVFLLWRSKMKLYLVYTVFYDLKILNLKVQHTQKWKFSHVISNQYDFTSSVEQKNK